MTKKLKAVSLSFLSNLSKSDGYDLQFVNNCKGDKFLLKQPKLGISFVQAKTDLEYEFKLLKKVNSSAVVKPVTFECKDGDAILLLEHVEGSPLTAFIKDKKLAVDMRYQLAIALTNALCLLHKQNVVHQGLNPDTILIDITDRKRIKACFVDIRHAREMSTSHHASYSVSAFDSRYFSPEQTGKVNQPLDYRTDIYNLGLLIYELFANRKIFSSKNLQDLVYAHVALKPDLESLERYPAVHSIVEKLLDKNPLNRYQSLASLKSDLVQAHKQPNERIQNESVIEQHVLSISTKLYGREKEVEKLLDAAKKTSVGESVLTLVSGYSGIGKSVLVKELHKPVCKHRGHFLSGKFEQIGIKPPLGAFIQAFHSLIRQRLAEPKTKRDAWRLSLNREVGDKAKILCDVLPELRMLFDIVKEPEVLSPSDELSRFVMTFKTFIKLSCAEKKLTVLFLDDMQWADNASMLLLERLCADHELKYMHIVCAYRNNEVDALHPFTKAIEKVEQGNTHISRIELLPLSIQDICSLLSDSLKQDKMAVHELAEVVFTKANGNPFFTVQLLDTLWRSELIAFKDSAWEWDIEKIRGAEITENVVELMTTKISELSSDHVEFLKVCSAIGSHFRFSLLTKILEKSVSDVLAICNTCVKEGLLYLMSGSHKLMYLDYTHVEDLSALPDLEFKFLHDKVQQAAYELLDKERRPEVHVKIGRAMFQDFQEEQLEENLYELTSQINLGAELLAQDEKLIYASLNYQAGIQANKSGANGTALELLLAGQSMLPENCWDNGDSSAYDIHLALLETQYLCTQYKEAEATSNLLLEKTSALVDKVPIFITQILNHIGNNQMEEAVSICVSTIQELGFQLMPSPELEDEFFKNGATKATDEEIMRLEELPDMTDELAKAALAVLAIGCAPAYFTCERMFAKFCNTMLCICLNKGNSQDSAYAYAIFGLYCSGVEQHTSAYRYCEAGLKMMERYDNFKVKPQIYEIFNVHVRHWTDPFRDALPSIHEGVIEGKRTGGIEFASYNAAFSCPYLIFSGQPFEHMWKTCNEYWQLLTQFGQGFCITYAAIWIDLIQQFKESKAGEQTLDLVPYIDLESIEMSGNRTALYSYYQSKAIHCLYTSNYPEAFRFSMKAREFSNAMYGMRNLLESEVCLALSAGMMGLEKESKCKKRRVLIKAALRKMKRWNRVSEGENEHKVMFVQAALHLVENELGGALKVLEKASTFSLNNGYLQDYALAQLLSFNIYRSISGPQIVLASFNQAIEAIRLWGASGLEFSFLSRFPELAKQSSLSSGNGKNQNLLLEDMTMLLDTFHSLSREMNKQTLQEKVLETAARIAGAEKAYLIDTTGPEPVIDCVFEKGKALCLLQPNEEYSESALNYCLSTRSTCHSGDALNTDMFVRDSYVQYKGVRSLLCLPIIGKDQLLGAIYLENNLSPYCFTKRGIEKVEVLVQQSAISIENAGLYTDLQKENDERKSAEKALADLNIELERRVVERTKALEQSNLELESTISNLKRAQNKLVESEKMASLGGLVAGIAHEINTPIGVGLGAVTHLREQVDAVKIDYEEGTLTESSFENLLSVANDSTEIVMGNIQRASKLIQSFKRVAVDQSNEHITEFDLIEYIREVIVSLKPKYKHLQLEFNIEGCESLKVLQRPGNIAQIMTNLIVNAVFHAFTDNSDGVINILIYEDRDSVVIEFSDNGVGIDAKIVDKIFEPFYTTKRSQGGSGLGLHVIYNLITQTMKGNISVKSKVKQGTQFIVKFPRNLDTASLN
ncbi:GAF domain-containing protein [Alteromonadaceae bacterium M269]|nr:GAF domain-containing protein [Alteromonadaceae bacterium M269]